MNSIIIQRPLLRNKHVICPQNEFYDLLCNHKSVVSSESRRGMVIVPCFEVFLKEICTLVSCGNFFSFFISLLRLHVLFIGVFAVFLSVLVCTYTHQQPWYGMCLCMLCVSVCLFADA